MNLNNQFIGLYSPIQWFIGLKFCKLGRYKQMKNIYFALNLHHIILIKVNMKLKRYFGILAVLVFATQSVYAQDGNDWRVYNPSGKKSIPDSSYMRNYKTHEPGEITVIADPRIQSLDLKKTKNPTKLNGYRVQIFFGDRSKAQDMRGEFIRKYPDVKAYISYLAPNFRLRVGDFRTRLEGDKFKDEMSRSFPGSYIVKDKIELPVLWDENTDAGSGE